MITHQPPSYRLDIDHGTHDAPPPRRQTSSQQTGTAYIWHSTTGELLPILRPDHPQYRGSMDRVLKAIERWNKGTEE